MGCAEAETQAGQMEAAAGEGGKEDRMEVQHQCRCKQVCLSKTMDAMTHLRRCSTKDSLYLRSQMSK